MSLPIKIYSVDSVRRIDRAAIDSAGISGYTLMTRAGEAAIDLAVARFPKARRWQVVCGGGNNGGDGYVVARLAADRGIAVSVVALSAPDTLGGDAATAYMDFEAGGGALVEFDETLDDQAELLIDALLGSGLDRDVEGRYAAAVAAINAHEAPVLALDIPSGLHGDSGAVLGVAVKADRTLTFVGLKAGLFLDQGPNLAGKLHFSGLDIPRSCYADESPVMRRLGDRLVRSLLPPRPRTAHKGDFGHVLVIGGGPGMAGAVRLCGEAALRSGAGLVTIATCPLHSAAIAASRPELMCQGVERAADLAPLIARATTIAVGPGLGTGDWSRALYEAALAAERPLVVDADALNLLAQAPTRRDDWILTPHPGEAARLLGTDTAAVQADRRAAIDALRQKFGGTVVLKGAGTLVAAEKGPAWLCAAGNPGMAAPGMGDALTGVIAALRAQGLSHAEAAAVGVKVHADAGDIAATHGERGMLASDLVAALRSRVNR